MNETRLTPLEERRKRLAFRAWHRGTREMDLLLGPFADAAAAGFSEIEVAAFEALLEVPDPDIYAWIIGSAETPADYDTPLFRRLCAFHREKQGQR
jgi:antitoxin CptB